ncbi:hypothetical protein [Cytobacillus sp. IB215316]|uniref:hypothetical protein n=1 Tax=Cytobacillus sp. IB215316 TaxID=3097354 RepID=UPI002A0C171B|nr:hypothetical protein [Cytobacillus sp. IB215316]MDX8363433.1 hypothetical protein [Cytobacillus sp. IB215316]
MPTAVIDVKTHSVITTLPVGSRSTPAFTPDGKLAYIGDTSDVSVFDVKTHSLISTAK